MSCLGHGVGLEDLQGPFQSYDDSVIRFYDEELVKTQLSTKLVRCSSAGLPLSNTCFLTLTKSDFSSTKSQDFMETISKKGFSTVPTLGRGGSAQGSYRLRGRGRVDAIYDFVSK